MRTVVRLGIRARFLLAASVLVPAVLALAWTATRGLDQLDSRVDQLYAKNVVTGERAQAVGTALDRVDRTSIAALASHDAGERRQLASDVTGKDGPAVDAALADLAHSPGIDTPAERSAAAQLTLAWAAFRQHWLGWRLESPGLRTSASSIPRFQHDFARVSTLSDHLARSEALQADGSASLANETHRATVRRVYEISAATIVLAMAVALWLAWTIVPRARNYSLFAARVASGAQVEEVPVRGSDELADLGRALNRMVVDRSASEIQSMRQTEFMQMMQLADSEPEAHELLKVHLERSLTNGDVVVLNRNNSEDRLEPRTSVPESLGLIDTLAGAVPRDCLAVRFGRPYDTGGDTSPLLGCTVCGRLSRQGVCQPLLVGGEVIGSVLATAETIGDADRMRIEASVTQAAPVLANLRNLAIAELRAATDALTGLPNNRSARDTARRMVAEAGRGDRPLSALLLDLDHFKQINDTFGHGPGDEVLAAVGEVLRSSIRESDFAGRYGGEEFLILLPDTDATGALEVAEKLRAGVATIAVPTVDRRITTSIGVATLPGDAHDTPTLLRAADRALYSAKANGRDRVESVATTDTLLAELE